MKRDLNGKSHDLANNLASLSFLYSILMILTLLRADRIQSSKKSCLITMLVVHLSLNIKFLMFRFVARCLDKPQHIRQKK